MTTRTCTACGTTNETDARFCEGCGSALERTCSQCGVEASATARFCRACGTALDENRATDQIGPTRKTVTVLFADLAGSTAFEEVVDAETAREVIGRYHNLLRETAQHHRAGVTKYIGDGFMAVWGVPEIGADDAEHAVEAALELQDRFVGLASRVADTHGVKLALRVAVNTGEVVVGAEDADLVGDALNVGARLESECPHGHVVVGEETWRATRGRHRYDPLGAVQVKGRHAPVPVYQWSGRRSETADSIAFVGRADELRRIRTVFDDALANNAARLITIIGDPGVGKSRLAGEFINAHPDARVVRANCAVEGTPALTPIMELLRSRDIDADVPLGTPERDRIVRALTGMTAGVAGSVEETFWALRRFAELLAAERPLIIVVDDIHWADSLLLDFIEHMAEWVSGVPVIMVALARPELRESRPELVTVGGCVSDALHLGGLEPSATAELAARVLGNEQLPAELVGRLPASTGGNPLFVRELVGMLVHDGVLVPRPEGWRLTVDVDAIAVPPTIQALLASRLERLNAADRRVLEVAAVVGTVFSPAAVCVLTGSGQAEIKAALDRLRRHDLAQPTGTYSGDEPMWRFHHVLIRDVAYRRLLKSERADLHERLAEWVQGGGASVAFDPDEVTARHLEAAHGYRNDLGLRDEHTGGLALRSARTYLTSARRALDRDELVSAGTQAARGAALAVGDSALQAELLLVGCESLLSAGDVAEGASLVEDLERLAEDTLAPWAICYRCQIIMYTDPSRLPEVDEKLQNAIDEFGRRSDAAGLAKAHRVRADARARMGRVGDCENDLFEALIAARRGGDHRQITAALSAAPNAALWGPSPAPKAGGRCLDVVRMQRMTTAAPSLEATSLRCLAILELLRGRPDKARTMLADAHKVVADLGLRHGLMETELFAGIIELMVGDPVAAEPHFQTALEGLGALGVGADAGQAAALLARSVLAQGRIDEADRYAAQSERIAGHNLKTAIAWRAVRAEILSAQGRHDAAVVQARDAVAVAAETDLVLDHADACLALSRVLASAGDARGASSARRDAESLYAAKDAVFMAGHAADTVQTTSMQPALQPTVSRLSVGNRASAAADAAARAMQAHDADAVVGLYSVRVVHDDHRRLSGNPIIGVDGLAMAVHHRIAQYPHLEWRHLAIRGERLDLGRCQWRDDAGNVSTSLDLIEVGDDDLIEYHGRFDEDDFESAYLELERRYYAGEGARFAENGRRQCAWLAAIWERDPEAARRITLPDFRWLASPSALKPAARSVDEFFEWLDERAQQLSDLRTWAMTMQWLSPNCFICRSEIQGAGADGEVYGWSRIYVGEYRNGLAAWLREFDIEDEDAAFAYAESLVAQWQSRLAVANAASRVTDRVLEACQSNDAPAVLDQFSPDIDVDAEDAAFAYAEERMRATSNRLAVRNRASELGTEMIRALQEGDVDALLATYADDIVHETRRHFTGAQVVGLADFRNAIDSLRGHYSRFELQTVAVRGDRLALAEHCWSDEAGNQSLGFILTELNHDGRVIYHCIFDEADFDSAYRELERRYYAGEGAQFAETGRAATAFVASLDALDVEAARRVCAADFRLVTPPTTLTPEERTLGEFFHWLRERADQVSSVKNFGSVLRWLSPTCFVALGNIRATGADGEQYEWVRIYLAEFRDGLLATMRQLDDEESAFAYAESSLRVSATRLAVSNRASAAGSALIADLNAKDIDAAVARYSEKLVYADRRPVGGALVTDFASMRLGVEVGCMQYSTFEGGPLAVRGGNLALGWARFSDERGNLTAAFELLELGDDGKIIFSATFDDDDFEGAYRELEKRYYAGEGAEFAEPGLVLAEYITVKNRGDLDTLFDELSTPDVHIDSRSQSVLLDRSAAEYRASLDQLSQLVGSPRDWLSDVQWVSPRWFVARYEREAVGQDGETYEWSRIVVGEVRHGRLASACQFELADEDAAFGYAAEQVRIAADPLALTNRARELSGSMMRAMQAGEIDIALTHFSNDYVFEDHRRISGDPVPGRVELRAAIERVLQQFSRFERRVLAVRGERLSLAWSRWSDAAGNQTSYLHVYELGDDGLIARDIRFDENDFDGAYRELETRYYAGEGAPFAEYGQFTAEYVIAMNHSDFDTMFNDLSWPDLRVKNRSRSGFPDRSAAELRSSFEELYAMVPSVRSWFSSIHWLSPTLNVGRLEREGVGTDGERYTWVRILVDEIRDGRLASICDFDVDDAEAAFAYAEELNSQT